MKQISEVEMTTSSRPALMRSVIGWILPQPLSFFKASTACDAEIDSPHGTRTGRGLLRPAPDQRGPDPRRPRELRRRRCRAPPLQDGELHRRPEPGSPPPRSRLLRLSPRLPDACCFISMLHPFLKRLTAEALAGRA